MAVDNTAAMRQAYDAAFTAFRTQHAQVEALGRAGELLGVPLPALLGPELMARIEVAEGVWARIAEAVRALQDREAALVEMDPGKWAIVPQAVLVGLGGSFLGGWMVWVGAVAAVLAFVGVFYLTDYYLEVRAAEAQNAELAADLERKAMEIVSDLCERFPDQCSTFLEQYRAHVLAAEQQRPPPGGPGAGGILAGLGGGALLAIVLMMAFGGFGGRQR